MKTYVIFDLESCVAFFGPAEDKTDAIRQLALQADYETWADIDEQDVRMLDADETALMKRWIDLGQKPDEWPFDEWQRWR